MLCLNLARNAKYSVSGAPCQPDSTVRTTIFRSDSGTNFLSRGRMKPWLADEQPKPDMVSEKSGAIGSGCVAHDALTTLSRVARGGQSAQAAKIRKRPARRDCDCGCRGKSEGLAVRNTPITRRHPPRPNHPAGKVVTPHWPVTSGSAVRCIEIDRQAKPPRIRHRVAGVVRCARIAGAPQTVAAE